MFCCVMTYESFFDFMFGFVMLMFCLCRLLLCYVYVKCVSKYCVLLALLFCYISVFMHCFCFAYVLFV